MSETDPRIRRLPDAITDAEDIEKATGVPLGSEALVHALLDTLPVLMWSAHADGEPSYISQRVVDYTGRPLKDFARLGWTELIHPDDLDDTIKAWSHAVQTGGSYHVKHRLRRADGQYRWFLVRGEPFRTADGRIAQFFGLNVDITEQEQLTQELRKSEEELRLSEERYALALAGSDESIYDWDLDTGRIYLAPRTQELLGMSPGEVWRAHEEWWSLMHYDPQDAPRRRAAMQAHIAGLTPMYDVEVRILLPGGVRWLHQRGRALRDAEGRAYRVVGSISDITERKLAQEEMLRLESRLRQAERFEAMGTLAGGIAHDFNNILGAILGFGERALRSTAEGSRLHHDIANVIVAGERGRTLVDRILSFSRGTGERVPVHVEKVVREALDLLQAKLPPRITLQTHLRAERAALQGDATQIHQLLMNLGTNAVQAMLGDGKLSVDLDAIEVGEPHHATVGVVAPGAWIVLRVTDEGTGIPAEILPRIFDPFFTTKDASVGTGLGLSLVLRIATELGGAIDVRSEPCVGSTFSIYLPRAGDALDEPRDSSLSAPAGQGQCVLDVDDEEPLLELTTDTLRELGYQPVGFASAIAALRAFRADPDAFDVLVTDHRMPGISGDRLIREIRRLRPLLPVILVSGYVGDTSVLRPDSGSADEVLVKPLRSNALATSLARLLGTGRDPGALR